jgi:hypothetical protein
MNPVVSPRPRSRASSQRPALRVLGAGDPLDSPADRPEAVESRRPVLRIVPGENRGRGVSEPRVAAILLAGADEHARATLRAELATTLPSRTRWVEADDVAGVLERAAHSRMAILAGDLDDVDAESLMRLLGRRHPELPVICVAASMPAVAGGRG